MKAKRSKSKFAKWKKRGEENQIKFNELGKQNWNPNQLDWVKSNLIGLKFYVGVLIDCRDNYNIIGKHDYLVELIIIIIWVKCGLTYYILLL